MNPNYIRPIPKRLEKRILTYDAKHGCNRGLRFYAYLTTIQKELVKITVAVRNKGKHMRLIKQVAIHGVYSDKCLAKIWNTALWATTASAGLPRASNIRTICRHFTMTGNGTPSITSTSTRGRPSSIRSLRSPFRNSATPQWIFRISPAS